MIDFLCERKRYSLRKHENKSVKMLMERMWLHTSPKIWWQWRAKLRRKKKKLIPVFLMFLNLIQFQNKNAEKSSQHKDLTFLAHVSELMTSKPISVFSWCSRVCPFPQSLLTKVLVTMNSCLKVLQFSCVKNGLYFIMHFCYLFFYPLSSAPSSFQLKTVHLPAKAIIST